MKFQTLAGCALAAFLCSCAATSIKTTWKSPRYAGGPVTKVAVVATAEQGLVRQGFENRFVAQLRKSGMTAVTTFDLMSLPEMKADKRAAAERLRSVGCQTVMVGRLVDLSSSYREVQPGGERYAGYVSGIESGTWYDYLSVGYMDVSPTYGSLKQKLYLEAALFDLGTGERLWSGLSKTVITDTMDKVAEMDPIVAKFVEAMRKDGIVP